nr:nucleotidyltransferase family protein [uncultured Intestinibacter sp.]
MNLLGLIVEYNPFHNGHLYHLNESKKLTNATHTIAVMSGNFMQRGTPHFWINLLERKWQSKMELI